MEMYDQAVQAFDPNKEENQSLPDQRKEYIVKKIGPESFDQKEILKQIDESKINTQRSLDQYDVLNPNEEPMPASRVIISPQTQPI